jgi:hypothetical protein
MEGGDGAPPWRNDVTGEATTVSADMDLGLRTMTVSGVVFTRPAPKRASAP